MDWVVCLLLSGLIAHSRLLAMCKLGTIGSSKRITIVPSKLGKLIHKRS